MKAIICCLTSQYIHSSLAPWYLLAGLRTFGDSSIDADVVEGTVNESVDAVVNRLLDAKPDVLGFCCYIWNITKVLTLANRVHDALPQCRIVLGGPEVSYRVSDILSRYPVVDFVLSGEGERPFARLCHALKCNASVEGIEGLGYRGERGLVIPEPYVETEIPPSPYLPEYFQTLNGRIAYLETSRGCPFSCAFCLSGRCGSVRYFPLERAKEELLLLANSGTQTVKFVDRTFNANRNRALALFRFIIEQYGIGIPQGVCFHFEMAGDLLDEKTITLLSTAPKGAIQLEIGLQSFHEPTLHAVHRKTNTERLTENIQKLIANGNIHIHLDLIAGLPQEDMNTFIQSFNKAFSLRPHMLQLGFLKLLYGAPMREIPTEYPCKFCSEPPYEVSSTPWLSGEELARLHRVEQVLDRTYNSGRFFHTVEYLCRVTALSPFELYDTLAGQLQEKTLEGVSLDTFTQWLYHAALTLPAVDGEILRDCLVCDRTATNPSGILPSFLVRNHERAKRMKRLMQSDVRFCRPSNVKRGVADLSDGRVVYADYCDRDPVSGAYSLHVFTESLLTRRYRYAVFDLDGTLVDPAEGITNSIRYALQSMNQPIPDTKTLLSFIGPPLMDSFREFCGMTDVQAKEALVRYREYYATKGLYQNQVYDGIPELLCLLQKQGYELLLATSKPEMYARRLLNHYGLLSYFRYAAGSDMEEKRVQKADVIQYALQTVKANAGEAVMIGDRKFDVVGAKETGLDSIGVLFGYGDREELQTAGAEYIAETVSDLKAMLLP